MGGQPRTYKRDRFGRFSKRQYVPRRKEGEPVAGYPTRTVRGTDIPYDPSTGQVPKELLASRFLARSQDPHRDCTRKARGILESPTPEEAADWWNEPSVCDIAGIDDCEELFELRRLMHPEAQRKIAVLANTRADQETIRRDLEGAFSPEELERMSTYQKGTPGLTVDARKKDGKLLGSCDFRTENRPGNMIMISDDAVGDGITAVHEGVHLLRHAEDRSENRDPTGRTNSAGVLASAREERGTREEAEERGRKIVVIVDEAGNLGPDTNGKPGDRDYNRIFAIGASITDDPEKQAGLIRKYREPGEAEKKTRHLTEGEKMDMARRTRESGIRTRAEYVDLSMKNDAPKGWDVESRSHRSYMHKRMLNHFIRGVLRSEKCRNVEFVIDSSTSLGRNREGHSAPVRKMIDDAGRDCGKNAYGDTYDSVGSDAIQSNDLILNATDELLNKEDSRVAEILSLKPKRLSAKDDIRRENEK